MSSNQAKDLSHLHWGIIGCGDVTEVKSGPAFNKVAGSSLQAVMRRDEGKAADYAQRHKVPSYYSNANDLINDPAVNAIYIATPPKYHEEYVMAALETGKPIYVEKPITTNVAACERLLAATTALNTKVSVAHYRRGLPMFLALKELIDNDTLGKVRLVRMNFLQPFATKLIAATEDNWRINPDIAGAGLFFDIAPHQIDMMLFLFGKARKYMGTSVNQSALYKPEDLVTGIIEFENNVIFTGIWGFTMPEEVANDTCEIIGDKGSVKFTFYGNSFELNLSGKKDTILFNPPGNIQQPMIQKVVNYFQDKGENPCSIQDALESMKIMQCFVYNR